MGKLEKAFEKFSRMAMQDNPFGGAGFAEACAMCGAARPALDALIRDRLGVGGDELLKAYRAFESRSTDKF